MAERVFSERKYLRFVQLAYLYFHNKYCDLSAPQARLDAVYIKSSRSASASLNTKSGNKSPLGKSNAAARADDSGRRCANAGDVVRLQSRRSSAPLKQDVQERRQPVNSHHAAQLPPRAHEAQSR